MEAINFFSVTGGEECAQKIILGHDAEESLFPAGDAAGKIISVDRKKIKFLDF